MVAAPLPVKRRPKSRYGCRNCKLRKLKCDEAKPQCVKCRSYGVICNFAGLSVPDLQPLSEKRDDPSSLLAARPNVVPSPRPAISNAVWARGGPAAFELDLEDQELFKRFIFRTARCLEANLNTKVWSSYMFEASYSSQFLTHGMLAMASVHDRYLGCTPTHHRSLRETHHWAQCTTLFNRWLRPPILDETKDPIWGTAGILAILAFASINTRDYREAWPLSPPDSADLEWLRLGDSKMKLWALVDPLRPGSCFRPLAETYIEMQSPFPMEGIDGMPPELAQLCGLTESSTANDGNSYYGFAQGVAHLLRMPKGDLVSLGTAYRTSAGMSDGFTALLAKKDPIALLLLALWYNKAREAKWWIDFRARYELPAICVYLQRHHDDDAQLQSLIPWDDVRPLM